MKRFLILIFSLICIKSQSQIFTQIPGYGQQHKRIKLDSSLIPPLDTLASSPLNSLAVKNSVLYIKKYPYWESVSSGNGTVKSVKISAPTGFAVSGSPITDTGTIVLSFASGYQLPTIASQVAWDNAYTNRITSLTTTGSSGAASLVSNVLNIPNYTLSGLGGVPTSRTITINGTAYDLSSDRSWTISAGISSLNGLTGSTQTFANGTSGTAPAFSSSGTTHTLNIPLAGSGITSGTISASSQTIYGAKTLDGILTLGNNTTTGEKFRISYNNASSIYTYFDIASNNTFKLVPGTASTSQFAVTKTDGSTPLFQVDGVNLRCGVNTASPTATLHVVNTNSYGIGSIIAEGNGGVGGAISFVKAAGGGTGDAIGYISFRNNGTDRARIRSTQADGTNDNGDLIFSTTTSGGLLTDRARIQTNGRMQVGSTTDVPSAQLAVVSTTGGFLPPKMTASQASSIASPAEGLLVYVTDTNGTFTAKGWWGYDGSGWQKLNN